MGNHVPVMLRQLSLLTLARMARAVRRDTRPGRGIHRREEFLLCGSS